MAEQAKGAAAAVTPRDVVDRLFAYQKDLALPSAAAFAREIGVTPDAISPQQLHNWRKGDDMSLESLLKLRPVVRARLLLERPAELEMVREGMRMGLAAARKALEGQEALLGVAGEDVPPGDATPVEQAPAAGAQLLARLLELLRDGGDPAEAAAAAWPHFRAAVAAAQAELREGEAEELRRWHEARHAP
jgi:hypothetical protein